MNLARRSYHDKHYVTESWESIFHRIGEPLRRNRARCPLHDGDSPFSLSVSEEKGMFHCHVCHAGGDKIDFIRQLHKCRYLDALRWFGIEPGTPLPPDPAIERRRRARAGLQAWAKRKGRELREKYYNRSRIELCARRRLEKHPDDVIGWGLLEVAYDGLPLDEVERLHDLLIGRDFEQMEAYRLLGGATE
jgi:hypothetical protein